MGTCLKQGVTNLFEQVCQIFSRKVLVAEINYEFFEKNILPDHPKSLGEPNMAYVPSIDRFWPLLALRVNINQRQSK
jgi:hypothetical protein